MIDIDKILSDTERCKGLIGLTPEWFAYLLNSFKIEYDLYSDERHRKRFNKERKRKRWPWNPGKLDTIEKKLFFILSYLKSYPTYEVQWAMFDMKRPRAYERVQSTLLPLMKALKKTEWFLQWRKKNWLNWCKGTQKLQMYL